jgi:serine/threonine protein kinase
MGTICRCEKKKDRYKVEDQEVLKLQENTNISKKYTNSNGKFNITTATFIKQKHFNLISDDYEILSQVGKGAFGVVKKVKHKLTQQLRAMKIVPRKSIQDDQIYLNEIEILKSLVKGF